MTIIIIINYILILNMCIGTKIEWDEWTPTPLLWQPAGSQFCNPLCQRRYFYARRTWIGQPDLRSPGLDLLLCLVPWLNAGGRSIASPWRFRELHTVLCEVSLLLPTGALSGFFVDATCDGNAIPYPIVWPV